MARILVADDDATNRELTIIYLELVYPKTNYITAQNISELRDKVEESISGDGIDMIITDVHMGRNDPRSYEVLKEFYQVGAEIPAIFLTGDETQLVGYFSLRQAIINAFRSNENGTPRDKIACYQKPVEYNKVMANAAELSPILKTHHQSSQHTL